MVTNTELTYMTRKTTPYPGDEYTMHALQEVRKAILEYKSNYENRTFDIEFSNGDNLVFQIEPRNLSHM